MPRIFAVDAGGRGEALPLAGQAGEVDARHLVPSGRSSTGDSTPPAPGPAPEIQAGAGAKIRRDFCRSARGGRHQIAYFVHGHGRGHASRALDVVPALRAEGHEVSLFASGAALPMLDGLGPSSERPLVRTGPRGWVELLRRSRADGGLLRAGGFSWVIADGDQGALLAARRAGIRCLAIGHDLVFTACRLPPGLSRVQLAYQHANAVLPTRLADARVAVNFVPLSARAPRTIVARPELNVPVASHPGRGLVCYFRDSNGAPVVDMARRACADVLAVVGSEQASVVERSAFRAALGDCLAVIGSAGSNLLAECVLLGKPVLALHRARDSEQALNAHLIAASGVGAACAFERLDQRVIDGFWRRAQAGEFQRVDLAGQLPTVSAAVLAVISLDDVGGARLGEP